MSGHSVGQIALQFGAAQTTFSAGKAVGVTEGE
jgi:hypothetical protein